ncbi:precorrin-2 C(20)-methyltransferase [Halocynthiibacter namhaensis]|uniref:precorrin-2 C(20)-methyltransferase n=1 Tax=Halocynthiibacter namhaensis TaxID=1290553 RepID=UPI000579211C|nr:precorrin-2 C(20)-methyltransferase [Halocynthiibacter namhaensis]
MTGIIYGAGLGPGAQDLMSVRTDRLLRNAKHVAFFRKKGYAGQARRIVEGMLREDVIEHAMEYPVTTEIPVTDPRYNEILAEFYEDWSARLKEIAKTEDVVVLCEGDPFFYGSFMHLYNRLEAVTPMQVIPGITGMSACWTATGQPITWGDDVLTVVMSTLSEDEITARAKNSDALVFMKIGRNLPKLRNALERAGRLDEAWIVERGAMPDQTVQKLVDFEGKAPYFSIVVIHGQGRRP